MFNWAGLLTPEIIVILFTWKLPYAQCTKNRHTCKDYTANYKFFQAHQLNSRRFPVFPGAISNSKRLPGFPGVADTLMQRQQQQEQCSSVLPQQFSADITDGRWSEACHHKLVIPGVGIRRTNVVSATCINTHLICTKYTAQRSLLVYSLPEPVHSPSSLPLKSSLPKVAEDETVYTIPLTTNYTLSISL